MWKPSGTKQIFVDSIPKITLTRDFCLKMWHVVQTVPTEVAWLGEVEGDPRKELKVTNLHIMKQKVSSATFEEEDNALVELTTRIGDAIFNIRCHGHSHVNMGVSPSGTDQKDTVENMKLLQVPYLIRLIANKRGELRVDFFDFAREINVDCIPFDIEEAPTDFPALDEELKTLLSPLVIQVPTVQTPFFGPQGGGVTKNLDDEWLYGDDDWPNYDYTPSKKGKKEDKAKNDTDKSYFARRYGISF